MSADPKSQTIWQRVVAAVKVGPVQALQRQREIAALNSEITELDRKIEEQRKVGAKIKAEIKEAKQILSAYGVTEEHLAAFRQGDKDAIARPFLKRVDNEAAQIVARMGVPFAPSLLSLNPGANTPHAEVVAAFEKAAEEHDPHKRALLFAEAQQLLAGKKSHHPTSAT